MNLKRAYTILVILASLIFYCCGNGSSTKDIALKYIKGTPIYVSESFLGYIPYACHNDTIIFKTYSSDYNLQIGTINSSELKVWDAVEKGAGPDQMMDCSATFDPKGNMLVVNMTNGWLGNLYRYLGFTENLNYAF